MYGLLTEPGEQSAEFTIYGSYHGMHKWVVVQINLRKALGKNQSIQSSSQSVHPCIHLSVLQARVVQRLDNAIHRINHYPVDKC